MRCTLGGSHSITTTLRLSIMKRITHKISEYHALSRAALSEELNPIIQVYGKGNIKIKRIDERAESDHQISFE